MGGVVKGVLNAVGLVPDSPDMTPVANATKDSAALAKLTADQQLAFAKQQYADQKPLVDALGKQALVSAQQDQQIAADAAARSKSAWEQNQAATQGSVGQMGLNALGAQYLDPAQTKELVGLQNVMATGTAEQKLQAQTRLSELQKTAEANAIAEQNANAARLQQTGQEQGAAMTGAYDQSAAGLQQLAAGYGDSVKGAASGFAGQMTALGEEGAQSTLNDANTTAGEIQAIARQRAADNELRGTTQANANIANSADQAQRELLRLGGDPNRLAAMSADIANQQQLARIGAGNQVAATNIGNLNAADDKALGIKSAALDQARSLRMGAKQAALGINMDANSKATDTGLNLGTQANQTQLQGKAAGLSLSNAGENAAVNTKNNAKATVDSNLNALQQGTANFGAGFANTSGQNAQTAITAGTAAGQGLSTAVNAGNQTTAATLAGMNGGMQAAQIQNQGALGLAAANTAQYNAESNAVNSAMKTAVGSAGQLFGFGDANTGILSDKNSKKDRKKVSDEDALEGLSSVQVDGWSYKDGMGDGGSHIGPMAQDMHRQFGDGVAPGGKTIDVISSLGLQHAAIRALDKRLAGLEQRKAS